MFGWGFVFDFGEGRGTDDGLAGEGTREIGIQPDALLCRADYAVPAEEAEKISLFTNVPLRGVISVWDVNPIYRVPRMLHEQGLDGLICDKLRLNTPPTSLKRWDELVYETEHPRGEVTIAMVGKYVDLSDSYKSLNEALRHAGMKNHARVKIDYVDSETITPDTVSQLAKYDAVLDILSPVMDVQRPDGGFYLWAKVTGDDAEFTRALFAQEHVTVVPGSYLSRDVDGFNPGAGRIRMALVAPLAECIEAAQRIRHFIQSQPA